MSEQQCLQGCLDTWDCRGADVGKRKSSGQCYYNLDHFTGATDSHKKYNAFKQVCKGSMGKPHPFKQCSQITDPVWCSAHRHEAFEKCIEHKHCGAVELRYANGRARYCTCIGSGMRGTSSSRDGVYPRIELGAGGDVITSE